MKELTIFLMGILFCIGCAKDSNNTNDKTTQNDDSNLNVKIESSNTKYYATGAIIENDYQNLIVITDPTNNWVVFEETSSLGRGDHIKVKQLFKVGPNHSQYERLKGKPLYLNVGWIAKSHDGFCRYYEPETNELNPTFIEKDLGELKEKIKSHRSKTLY